MHCWSYAAVQITNKQLSVVHVLQQQLSDDVDEGDT